MEHKRITVEEVLAAYESTGVRKAKCAYHWTNLDAGDEGTPPQHCGCPAFVVALARTGTPVEEACRGKGAANFTHEQFQHFYLAGFTVAVDTGRNDGHTGNSLHMQGREDGLAVRAALWPEPVIDH